MPPIVLRPAAAGDVGILLQLVRELAAYEKASDAVLASEADLLRHGFGAERRFEALLAFVEGKPAGFAIISGSDRKPGRAGPRTMPWRSLGTFWRMRSTMAQ